MNRKHNGLEVYLAAPWQSVGRALFLTVVMGLGPVSTWTVVDAEADTKIDHFYDHLLKEKVVGWNSMDEKPITFNDDGTLTVPIKAHNYRQIMVTTREN